MDFSSFFLSMGGAVELGVIYGFMALGIFVSFRILNIADLTVDGSFTFGAAASVILTAGGHPYLGLLAGVLAGALAGLITALLQTVLKIQPILAGIMTMTALYSVNLHVMKGQPNVSLLQVNTIFDGAASLVGESLSVPVVLAVSAIGIIVLLALFFQTHLGMCIRATGDNEAMVRSSSINAGLTKTVGLMVANATVGFSGALIGQYQRFSDMNMGIGMVAVALASLIIGEVLFGTKSLPRHIAAVMLGSIVYRILISLALRLNGLSISFQMFGYEIGIPLRIQSQDFKLVSALIVTAALSYPAIREKLELRRLRKEAAHHA